MVIYVDVLLFINLIVDFLLLSLTAKIAECRVGLKRKLLASFISSLFSLYIFLPKTVLAVELLLRLTASTATVLVAFGYKAIKKFSRNLFIFYTVSFLYGGFMSALWMMFKPRGMSVNNGVVYFDISPIVLIIASFVFYIILLVIGRLTERKHKFSRRCTVNLYFDEKHAIGNAIVDTGHSLKDVFGDSIMIIIDINIGYQLFGEEVYSLLELNTPVNKNISSRFRLSVVDTVSGEKILPSVKIDKIHIESDGKSYNILKPIVVLTESKINDDCSIIVPPEALAQ